MRVKTICLPQAGNIAQGDEVTNRHVTLTQGQQLFYYADSFFLCNVKKRILINTVFISFAIKLLRVYL